MRLTEDMQRVVMEQRLAFVASVTPDGRPTVSPKGTTVVFDDEHLMFADVASPGTVANVATNPSVEVNVVDPILRKGYRFKGEASVHVDDDRYDEGIAVLAHHGSSLTRDRIRSIVLIAVTDAAEVVSPGYDSGATEREIADAWLDRVTTLHRARFGPAGGGGA